MTNEEQMEGEEVLGGNERGIYTLTSSDLETIGNIERMKSGYLMELEGMQKSARIEQLLDLLSNMQVLMESYNFDDYLKKNLVNGYSFYYVKDHVTDTDGELEFVRLASEIAFTNWKNVLRMLGVGLPTYRSSVKKKVIDSLFQLAGDLDEDKLIADFNALNARYCGKTKFDFFTYCVSRLKDYDIDFNMVVVGKARSSKSTFGEQFVKRFYSLRGFDFYAKIAGRPMYEAWVNDRCIYDQKQGSNAIRSGEDQVNMWDETGKTHDRRKSMTKGQVQNTSDMNFFASKRNVNLMLIQNFSDLDLRATTKASAVLIVVERGRGLLFVDARYIPLAKDQFSFEQIMQNPDILKYAPMAIHMLKRMSSYVCELTWDKMADDDPFHLYYLANKTKNQERLLLSPLEVKSQNTQRTIVQKMVKNGMKQIDVAKALGITRQYVNDMVNPNSQSGL